MKCNKKILGITGWKNNGKTTLVTSLVAALTMRGYKVSTIKHAHHNFDIDHEGTDSWKHRQAGAQEVAIVSSKRFAYIHENTVDNEMSLSSVIDLIGPCDLIIVEGFKNEPHEKIEVRLKNGQTGLPLNESDNNIVAIASDMPIENVQLPYFNIDNIEGITDFAEDHLKLRQK
ncbi:molybdopterin-guanine dinucleotide biosynthesis protein B [Bartonella tamiae]|uniref:Molybdopterin-guanine dinucleotide biosynthesis protein B n=1 Tax=Bartonella tamiae Th239 TaxID=1094558 RepID=J0QSA3_9HYPH|nr:molybdopterin-guanine dinucleotide biosynthesis protein B [Bartonella tamiae]EJF88746.1 molybdopterin-guanine dinucleotide biosynthesis protein B [Bartonella tamiae Th239]EJF95004.1 molybdopterin-guanine dinucleotide biosynthesis protein B [Bartonella tamiae Th307]